MKTTTMAERELIAAIRRMAGQRHAGLRVSIGDDCAVWRPRAGQEMIVTTDQLVEGVHYPAREATPSPGHGTAETSPAAAPPLLRAERLRLSESALLRQGYALPGQVQPGKKSNFRKGRRAVKKLIPGGIAACSRWLSAVCETTGNRDQEFRAPVGAPAYVRTPGPLPGSGRGTFLTGGDAKTAPPPATSCDPSGINSSQILRDQFFHSSGAFPHEGAAQPPAGLLGARLVGRGLSDIAAMGGEPRLVFLNVAWPTTLPQRWRLDFLHGFAFEVRRWKTAWAGGDVSGTSGPAVASITVIGEVPAGKALLRSGARPGDLLYVSGRLGAGALRITPRLPLGLKLRNLATACMDLSDGLSTDLRHLCEESGIGALVEASRIPAASSLDRALNWGEDYELLFTARPSTDIPARIAGVAITCIGRCTRRSGGVRIEDPEGRRVPLEPRGWQHLG